MEKGGLPGGKNTWRKHSDTAMKGSIHSLHMYHFTPPTFIMGEGKFFPSIYQSFVCTQVKRKNLGNFLQWMQTSWVLYNERNKPGQGGCMAFRYSRQKAVMVWGRGKDRNRKTKLAIMNRALTNEWLKFPETFFKPLTKNTISEQPFKLSTNLDKH